MPEDGPIEGDLLEVGSFTSRLAPSVLTENYYAVRRKASQALHGYLGLHSIQLDCIDCSSMMTRQSCDSFLQGLPVLKFVFRPVGLESAGLKCIMHKSAQYPYSSVIWKAHR